MDVKVLAAALHIQKVCRIKRKALVDHRIRRPPNDRACHFTNGSTLKEFSDLDKEGVDTELKTDNGLSRGLWPAVRTPEILAERHQVATRQRRLCHEAEPVSQAANAWRH